MEIGENLANHGPRCLKGMVAEENPAEAGEVEGEQIFPTERYGLRTIPQDFYYFRTKPNQPFPWIISNRIRINRILSHEEVEKLCRDHGVEAQKMED